MLKASASKIASRVTNKLNMSTAVFASMARWKKSSMLREMQKLFPRLLLIPSPPSSFNQTVNHLTVRYGFIAAPNRTRTRLYKQSSGWTEFTQEPESCSSAVVEANIKNLQMTHTQNIYIQCAEFKNVIALSCVSLLSFNTIVASKFLLLFSDLKNC